MGEAKRKKIDISTPQVQRLRTLMNFVSGWGAMIYLKADGDVGFLAPLLPELRGYEIVSESPDVDGRCYDVWLQGDMLKSNQTIEQIAEWMRPFARTDDVLKANLAAWADDVMRYYRIPPKRA